MNIVEKMYKELGEKMGLTVEEYREFSGVCYQHTQGYYSDKKECDDLIKRYNELKKLGEKRLNNS